MGPFTVQPLTFELSEALVSTLLGSKVKCVVKKAYKQSGRGLVTRLTSILQILAHYQIQPLVITGECNDVIISDSMV